MDDKEFLLDEKPKYLNKEEVKKLKTEIKRDLTAVDDLLRLNEKKLANAIVYGKVNKAFGLKLKSKIEKEREFWGIYNKVMLYFLVKAGLRQDPRSKVRS